MGEVCIAMPPNGWHAVSTSHWYGQGYAPHNQSARAQRMIETLKAHLLQSRQLSLF
jgi:hypothetical protein